jgi:hypothetical protein
LVFIFTQLVWRRRLVRTIRQTDITAEQTYFYCKILQSN